MPVYEYRCKNCNQKYEIFYKGKEDKEKIVCPKCSSRKNKKLLSGFSAGNSNSFENPCSSGSCGIAAGGCASGICGLN